MLLLIGSAAAISVLHAGAADTAAHHGAADAGIPVWDTRPVDVRELLPGDGVTLVGAGRGAACDGEALTNASLRDSVARAEKLVSVPGIGRARAELTNAAARLACLSEPAEASLLARMFVLQAHVLVLHGDQAGAAAAFRLGGDGLGGPSGRAGVTGGAYAPGDDHGG